MTSSLSFACLYVSQQLIAAAVDNLAIRIGQARSIAHGADRQVGLTTALNPAILIKDRPYIRGKALKWLRGIVFAVIIDDRPGTAVP
jgi:hypothetical protein